MDLMYLIGEPGVGKSTLMDYLTRGLPYEETEHPIPFRRYDCGVLELGRRREDFSGTDAYPMDIQPKVVQLLGGMRPKLVLAEGDRLANMKFFDWCTDVLGYKVWIYNLYGSALADARREKRGHVFDAAWLKGRQTKVEKLAYRVNAAPLDADLELVDLEARIDNPVMEAMRLGRGVEVA